MRLKMAATLLVFLFLISCQSYAAGIRTEASANNVKSSSNENDSFILSPGNPKNDSSLVDSTPQKRFGIKNKSDYAAREQSNVGEFDAKFTVAYIESLVDALVDLKLFKEKIRKDNPSVDVEESPRLEDTENGDSTRGFISRINKITSTESAPSDSNDKVAGKNMVDSDSSQDDSTIESRNQVVGIYSPESNENEDSHHPKTVCYKQDSKNLDKYTLISKESPLKDISDSEVHITCININRLDLLKFKTNHDYSNSYDTQEYIPPHVNHHTFSDRSYLDSNYQANPYPEHYVPAKHDYGYSDHYIQDGYLPGHQTPEFNEYNQINYAHNTGLHQNYQKYEGAVTYDIPNVSTYYPVEGYQATQSYEHSNEYKPLQKEYHYNGGDHTVTAYANNNFQHKSGDYDGGWSKNKNHHGNFPATANNNNYNLHDSSYFHQPTQDNHLLLLPVKF